MKKIILVFSVILCISINTKAQVSVNVNLGTPPVWAPADRVESQYYYLPDIGAYYDVPASRFIYIKNGNWFRSANLPYRYRNYNLKNGKVVYLTDYKGNKPYAYYKTHKVKYPKVINAYHPKYKNNGNGKRLVKHNGKGKHHGNGKGHK